MHHSPIKLDGIGLEYPNKHCFENFSTTIYHGDRIAIIGRNGSGKSTLLNILRGEHTHFDGQMAMPDDIQIGYVPQLPEEQISLSGGQQFQAALTKALAQHPNVLLLDEPTNHLDSRNKKSLLRMLAHYDGTLIIVSHDPELLRKSIDCLWHIDQQAIHIVNGSFDDYQRERALSRSSIEKEQLHLDKQQKQIHEKRMREQNRSAKSKAKGKKSIAQRKWPTVVSNAKADRAGNTSGKKMAEIAQKRQDLSDRLSECRLPEVITPSFGLSSSKQHDSGLCVSISNGQIAYDETPLISELHFALAAGNRTALLGDNGSGKSTLVKAILSDPSVNKSGDWYLPKTENIGYLDQAYRTLVPTETVLETIQHCRPNWDHAEIRQHLNAFLFRKNEEVNLLTSQLSGGEKARLSLAQIAAKPPQLLILDEITNNLDLETREHVIQILRDYPGTLLVISHDDDFLNQIEVTDMVKIKDGRLVQS